MQLFCSVCGSKDIHAKNLCDRHYRQMQRHGHVLPEKANAGDGKCKWEGCENKVRALGYCSGHYKAARKSGILNSGKNWRDHPLYSLWWARRKADILSDEWKNDFTKFVKDVGERPGKYYSLMTLREGPFGPDNFKWHPHLKQLPGESKREFYARKWQAQNISRPGWQRDASLKKRYGISISQYNEILAEQENVCAICGNEETKIDHKTQQVRRLAVDHCHSTGRIRGLLCGRCNTVIGQIDESTKILKKMIEYLNRRT